LQELLEQYKSPKTNAPVAITPEWVSQRQQRVLDILRHWIANYDFFKHAEVVETFRKFLPSLPAEIQSEFATLLKGNSTSNEQNWTANDEEVKREFNLTVVSKHVILKPKLRKRFSANHIKIFDVSATELARQLCLDHQREFRNININDFSTTGSPLVSPNSRSNLSQFVQKFNVEVKALSQAVMKATNSKERYKLVKYLIDVGYESLQLCNLNFVFMVVSALSQSFICRIVPIWNKIKTSKYNKKWERLLEVTSAERNYQTYRGIVKDIPPSSPCVPYPGKFLTDLIIINDGNADLIGTHINFHKRILWYTVVSKLLSFQRVPYLFEYVPAIQQLLRDITHPKELLDEEQLYQISLQIFPKGATKEQD